MSECGWKGMVTFAGVIREGGEVKSEAWQNVRNDPSLIYQIGE